MRAEGDTNLISDGLYDIIDGVRAHEIIIETPCHHKDLSTIAVEILYLVLCTIADRITELKKDSRLKYVFVFKNHGQSLVLHWRILTFKS